MERETDNSKMYKYGNGNKTQLTWKCFGTKFLLYKPDRNSCRKAGRTESVFLSFLATNGLFHFFRLLYRTYAGIRLPTAAHGDPERIKTDQKEYLKDE